MLGGMLLPFFQGLFFYNEPFTLAKGLCLGFIAAALLLTVERGEKKGGAVFYIGVFVLNGMSGVLSKLYQELPFEKASNADYSLWISIMSATISGIILLMMIKKVGRVGVKAVVWGVNNGGINRIANFLLLIALTALPASVQYPFITGGVIAFSAVISTLTGQHPSKKEIIAVILAFLGIYLLIAL